jgi:DNA-binding NtrC family response regulator
VSAFAAERAAVPGARGRVLVADDEANFRRVLSRELSSAGFEVVDVGRGDDAIARLAAEPFDVALLDLRMPGAEGMDVLRAARRSGSRVEAIVLTGHGSIDSVVQAMKLGAFDYLTKPCRLAEVELLVGRAARRARGEPDRTGAAPQPEGSARDAVSDIAGASPALARVIGIVDRAAPTDAPVLIEGESGTGKELLARRLHARSKVSGGPFVVVNCGALSDALVLSELFGHEKGAFTGADRQRAGLLERAAGGTAFFDEVGELSLEAQVRLLRFLQFGELRRVGSEETRTVRARVVAATNRALADEARAGRFREDLFYRLHTIHVTIPPLRERPGDIPRLAALFLARSAQGAGRRFDDAALALLAEYRWPGNVRELENIVERLAILSSGPAIGAADVREHFDGLALEGATPRPPSPAPRTASGRLARPAPPPAGAAPSASAPKTLREMEREAVIEALARTGGDKPRAAEQLGIALKTLYNKIKAYGLGPAPKEAPGGADADGGAEAG